MGPRHDLNAYEMILMSSHTFKSLMWKLEKVLVFCYMKTKAKGLSSLFLDVLLSSGKTTGLGSSPGLSSANGESL